MAGGTQWSPSWSSRSDAHLSSSDLNADVFNMRAMSDNASQLQSEIDAADGTYFNSNSVSSRGGVGRSASAAAAGGGGGGGGGDEVAAGESDVESCMRYLAVVDDLQQLIEKIESELRGGQEVLQDAVENLKKDFMSLLESGSLEVDLKALYASISAEDGPDFAQPPELMEDDTIATLALMVQRLIGYNCQADCTKFYRDRRSLLLRMSFDALGVQRVVKAEIYAMPWSDLEKKMKQWNQDMHLGLILLSGEKNLCDRVFQSLTPLSEQTFLDIATPSMLSLIFFGDAVGGIQLSPEKLFAFLDMYETVVDLQQTIEDLFPGSEGASVRRDYENLRAMLGLRAREIFERFEQTVKEVPVDAGDDAATTVGSSGSMLGGGEGGVSQRRSESFFSKPWGLLRKRGGKKSRAEDDMMSVADSEAPGNTSVNCDGKVHAITSYVVNYVKLLCNSNLPYFDILEAVFLDSSSSGSGGGGDSGSQRNAARVHGKLAHALARLLDALAKNLEARAATLNGDELGDLFVMNNLDYMLTKLEGSDAGHLLGVAWFGQYSEKVENHRDAYIKKVATRFDDIWNQGPMGPPIPDRFKMFNFQLERLCNRQSTLTIANDGFRNYIKKAISTSILGKYKAALTTYKGSVPVSQLSAEDAAKFISDAFPAPTLRTR